MTAQVRVCAGQINSPKKMTGRLAVAVGCSLYLQSLLLRAEEAFARNVSWKGSACSHHNSTKNCSRPTQRTMLESVSHVGVPQREKAAGALRSPFLRSSLGGRALSRPIGGRGLDGAVQWRAAVHVIAACLGCI